MNRFFTIFVLFLSAFSAVRCDEDLKNFIKSRLYVGTCRASCIEKFLPQNEFRNGSELGCRTIKNWKCYMCWDYCGMLGANEEKMGQMCGDNICMEGCQYSCQFYKDVKIEQWSQGNSQIQDVKFVNSSILTWNYETIGEVFTVFGSQEDGKWHELRQSAENHIPIYEKNIRNVTIFGLSAHGLVSHAGLNLMDGQNARDEYAIFDEIIKKSKKVVDCVKVNLHLVFVLSLICSFVVVLSVCVLFLLLKSMRTKQLVERTTHGSIFYIEVDMDSPNAFLSEV